MIGHKSTKITLIVWTDALLQTNEAKEIIYIVHVIML